MNWSKTESTTTRTDNESTTGALNGSIDLVLFRRLTVQSWAEATRVFSEDFTLGAFGQPGSVDRLLDAFGPGRVAMRPVRGEEPHILAELLDAEFDRALPAVDPVKIPALGEDLARHPLQIGHVT